MPFKVYRKRDELAWTLRGKSGELGAHDHVICRDVEFCVRKRSGTGYAQAAEAIPVADTRLLDGRIVLRDGAWVFETTGRPVQQRLPMVVFNRLGAFIHAGSVTQR